jgi:hypothetical protein
MKESKRQKNWLEKGYTKEQIENHLRFERRKSKESREKRKRLNEKNKKVIAQVKSDLLGKTFDNRTFLSIKPTVDGIGFWFKYHRVFKDGSNGDFRYFSYFDEYTLKSFLENLI